MMQHAQGAACGSDVELLAGPRSMAGPDWALQLNFLPRHGKNVRANLELE